MTTEKQICLNCGKAFGERRVDGPNFAIDQMHLRESSKMCPNCGGDVIWQTPDNRHDYEIPEYARVGLLDKIGFIIVTAVLLAVVVTGIGHYFGWWQAFEIKK